MALQLVVSANECRGFIQHYHDSIFAGHLPFRVCCPKVSLPSLCANGTSAGHCWDQVAMDILDMSVTTDEGNQYVLVIVNCFSRWPEACLLPNKTVEVVAVDNMPGSACRR